MGANDKLEATFHSGEGRDMTPEEVQDAQLADRELRERRLAELATGTEIHISDGVLISLGLQALIKQSGENSRDHGFHEDWPQEPYVTYTATGEPVEGTKPEPIEEHKRQIALAVTQKLMLMAEELIESFGEIRDGRSISEIYFVDKKGLIGPKGAEYEEQAHKDGIPLLKPEGFLVELADLFIRGADLVYLLDQEENFLEALHAKHEYNKTRPFKHGRQF